VLLGLGNDKANATWEARLEHNVKPAPDGGCEAKGLYIQDKYIGGHFLPKEVLQLDPNTALLAAASEGDLAKVAAALGRGAQPQTSEAASMGQNALHRAAISGHQQVAQLLVNDGRMSVSQATWEGKTARELASAAAHDKLAFILEEEELAQARKHAEKVAAHEALAAADTEEEATGWRAAVAKATTSFARAMTPSKNRNQDRLAQMIKTQEAHQAESSPEPEITTGGGWMSSLARAVTPSRLRGRDSNPGTPNTPPQGTLNTSTSASNRARLQGSSDRGSRPAGLRSRERSATDVSKQEREAWSLDSDHDDEL